MTGTTGATVPGVNKVAPPQAGPVLEARSISKSFGGTQVLDRVSIEFRPGEAHAIIGENGAGKSTLVKILCGFYPSASFEGELVVGGETLEIGSIHEAESHGIFLVPQDLQIVPALSVAENLFLNRELQRFGFVQPMEMLPKAAAWLRDFQFDVDPSTPISELMLGEQQLVVIARAMMQGVKVIALDEPTASLTDAEAQVLFRHVERLKERGIAVIYISHRLDEIAQIAQKATVLRDGRVVNVMDVTPGKAITKRIVHAMVGIDVKLQRRKPAKRGAAMLGVGGMTIGGAQRSGRATLEDVGFEVRAGEVLGIFGSVGCGADDLVRALFGITTYSPLDCVSLRGETIAIRSPAQAIEAGIGYLPGHRQRDGVFPLMSVGHNISILALGGMARSGAIVPYEEAELINRFYSRFRIKAASVDTSISTLSGGNQQKAMLARILSRDPEIMILHEPTQGVDIATKQDVYRVIDELAQAGKAVILASSDLEEILMNSDRVLVLKQGRTVGTWDRKDATHHAVMAAATGGQS